MKVTGVSEVRGGGDSLSKAHNTYYRHLIREHILGTHNKIHKIGLRTCALPFVVTEELQYTLGQEPEIKCYKRAKNYFITHLLGPE